MMRRMALALACLLAALPALAAGAGRQGADAFDLDQRIRQISNRMGAKVPPPAPKPPEKKDAPAQPPEARPTPARAPEAEAAPPPVPPSVLPSARRPAAPKRRWKPDFRTRDIPYMGQWVDVFVGRGYMTTIHFPKPIAAIVLSKQGEIGLAEPFKPGLTTYIFKPVSDRVDVQIVATARDGTQYMLHALDGNQPAAHGRINAGLVRLIEKREPPRRGIPLDELDSWSRYGAGALKAQKRMARLLAAMIEKENVSGYRVLNFRGKVIAEDPFVRMHLVRIWHQDDAVHPLDGIEVWLHNISPQAVALVPARIKAAFHVEGDFMIHYAHDVVLPGDYERIYIVTRLAESRRPLDEVPVDINLNLDDIRQELRSIPDDPFAR